MGGGSWGRREGRKKKTCIIMMSELERSKRLDRGCGGWDLFFHAGPG